MATYLKPNSRTGAIFNVSDFVFTESYLTQTQADIKYGSLSVQNSLQAKTNNLNIFNGTSKITGEVVLGTQNELAVENNKIGINTNTPNYELDIVGSLNVSDDIYINNAPIENLLTDLETTTTQLTSDVLDLQNQVGDNDDDITALQTLTATNSTNIATNSTNIATNSSDVSALQTLTTTHSTDIGALQSDVADNFNDITTLNNSVATNYYTKTETDTLLSSQANYPSITETNDYVQIDNNLQVQNHQIIIEQAGSDAVNGRETSSTNALRITSGTNNRSLWLGYDDNENIGYINCAENGAVTPLCLCTRQGAYVGINTTNPTSNLDVAGTIKCDSIKCDNPIRANDFVDGETWNVRVPVIISTTAELTTTAQDFQLPKSIGNFDASSSVNVYQLAISRTDGDFTNATQPRGFGFVSISDTGSMLSFLTAFGFAAGGVSIITISGEDYLRLALNFGSCNVTISLTQIR